jgi:hypothetical protein
VCSSDLIPLYDDTVENINRYFEQTNTVLLNAILNNERVLIHCMVGRSRSVTLALAFLIYLIKTDYNLDNIDIICKTNLDLLEAESKILCVAKRVAVDNIKSNKSGKAISDVQISGDDMEQISKIEEVYPKLYSQTETFVIYKKTKMIKELEEIQDNYNIQSSQNIDKSMIASNLVNILLVYIHKYRSIAEPNANFINQLINYAM